MRRIVLGIGSSLLLHAAYATPAAFVELGTLAEFNDRNVYGHTGHTR